MSYSQIKNWLVSGALTTAFVALTGSSAFAAQNNGFHDGRDFGRDARYGSQDDSHRHQKWEKKRQKEHQRHEDRALRRHQQEERYRYGNSAALRRHQHAERETLRDHQYGERRGLQRHQRIERNGYYDRDGRFYPYRRNY